ncbi:Xrra1 [Columba livia]|nr:Xrra1 [Columba livia]
MATTKLYKTGDESNYTTNCFPARNILRASKEGRWVLAHRATPRAWTEKGTTGKTPQQRRNRPHSASVKEKNENNVLDEPFLMKHHHLKNPSDLCFVNISSQNLVLAKEEDFEKFDCVAFINAAENLLTLEDCFFCFLQRLDLSYNNLSSQDIWTLGDLSQLKVLRLTGNRLRSLPPDLAGSWNSAHSRFTSLEVLSLDDNRLSDPSVFVSLSHLCSLRELNLDRNRISAVPYLHQAESRQFFLHPALDGGSFRAEWYKSLSSLWQQPRPPQQEDTEVPAELEVKKGQLGSVISQNDTDPDRTGQPPLLTWLLQHNLGIKLVRQKSVATRRGHFSIPLKASRKVTSHLPKVTKRPLMLEAPVKTFLCKPLPAAMETARDAAASSPTRLLSPISSTTPSGRQQMTLEEEEGDSRPSPGPAEEDVASFFMTQVEDVATSLPRPMAEGRPEKTSERSEDGSSQVVPERYKGYEELLGGDTDPDFIEPVGIQKNVQALYYILKHPLVYRDAKPRLDSVQKPYVPQKKRGRMPGPPARQTRAEVLEGILTAMGNTSTFTEVPLVSVLQKKKSSPRAYREARRLMREFQEMFQIPPATLGEKAAEPSDEEQVIKALLSAATSKQGSPKQLPLPAKSVAKKVPKV